jgi:tetratricopeptide (TPR) repeat protein
MIIKWSISDGRSPSDLSNKRSPLTFWCCKRSPSQIDLFNEVEPSQNKLLYEGLCYLKLEDVDQSIGKFENGLKMPPEGLKDNLEWYLFLAYIKNGNIQKAIKYA